MNLQHESEIFWIAGASFNRMDMKRGIFQRKNMEYLAGEYDAFLYDDEVET